MSQLRQLHLLGGLTGGIPSELGRLRNLESLGLENNDLAGNIPASLGQVDSLRAIAGDNNPKMSGTLPHALTNLSNLDWLSVSGTQLCAPSDTEFQEWLESRIPEHRRYLVPACQ